MHYPGSCPGNVRVPPRAVRNSPSKTSLEKRIQFQIINSISEETYQEFDGIVPFKWDTSIPTIINALLPFCTEKRYNHAVYVLECLQTPARPGVVAKQGVSKSSIRRYEGVWKHRRLVYVGRSRNLIERIYNHLNEPGRKGANFTAIYPPVRVLGVGWFHKSVYKRAEVYTQKLLQERFPHDFISQPG
jgi:hypothetical protein